MSNRRTVRWAFVVVLLLVASAWWAIDSEAPDAPERPDAMSPASPPRAELVDDRLDASEAALVRKGVGDAAADDTPVDDEEVACTVRVQVRRRADGEPVPAEVLLLGRTPDSCPMPRSEFGDYGRLWAERIARQRQTDDAGAAVFTGVAPGTYRAALRPSSLPPGFLPLWDEEHKSIEFEEVSFDATSRTASVVLHVEQGGVVFGNVYGPGGVPVRRPFVQATPFVQGVRKQVQTVGSEDGYYELRLAQAEYAVVSMVGRDSPLTDVTSPPPALVAVVLSSSIQADFVYENGELSVTGVVVDQNGRPVNALPVSAHYCYPRRASNDCALALAARRTKTASDGSFTIVGLHPIRIGIQFGSGRAVLERHVETIVLELGEDRRDRDLGQLVVQRNDRYWVDGTIVLDADALASAGVELRDVELEIEDLTSGETKPVHWVQMEARAFGWGCEPGTGPVVLRMKSELGVVERRLVPKPSTTEEIEIVYP